MSTEELKHHTFDIAAQAHVDGKVMGFQLACDIFSKSILELKDRAHELLINKETK